MLLKDCESAALDVKLQFEREAWNQGNVRVAGLDEVGRGPLAGPVVAACVVFSQDLFRLPLPEYFCWIDDSKRVSARRREELAGLLRGQKGLEIGIGVVDQTVIDQINILEATRLAMKYALDQLVVPPDHLLIDGMNLPAIPIGQTALIKGDSRSLSIGAASIIAKVFRDQRMSDYDGQYPEYGFAQHKGYGTADHLKKIRIHGPCDLHRKSFAPLKGAPELFPA